MSQNLDLIRKAFGENWKTALVERLNTYDLSRNWPAYRRKDGLGIFAAAVLKNKLPIIGHGRTAWRMELNAEELFNNAPLLSPTLGIARFVNQVLADSGMEMQAFDEATVLNMFANFSPDFQKDLLVGVMLDAMVDFYHNLSNEWKLWSKDLSASGKVSPIDIWFNYAKISLAGIREDIENVLDTHKAEASNVVLDLESFGKQCHFCGEKTSTLCGRCKSAFYCSVQCQKQDWRTHKLTCAKK